MDITRLREFLKLFECGGFRSAAAELFLSQAALSRHIAEMETACGHLLVIRENPPVLTPAGEVLEQYAKRFISLHDQMYGELRSIDPATGYKIKLNDVIFDEQLSVFFESVQLVLKEKLIGAELAFVPPPSPSIVDAVAAHEIDLGVIAVLARGGQVLMPLSESVDYVLLPQTAQPLVAFCSRSGPFAELDAVKPHHLASAHLFLAGAVSPYDSRQSLCLFADLLTGGAHGGPLCSAVGLPLEEALEGADDDAVFLVGASSAALLPHRLHASFSQKPISPKDYRIGICLVMRKNWKELAERINREYNL